MSKMVHNSIKVLYLDVRCDLEFSNWVFKTWYYCPLPNELHFLAAKIEIEWNFDIHVLLNKNVFHDTIINYLLCKKMCLTFDNTHRGDNRLPIEISEVALWFMTC